jgi:hypothetical protein
MVSYWHIPNLLRHDKPICHFSIQKPMGLNRGAITDQSLYLMFHFFRIKDHKEVLINLSLAIECG